MREQTKPWKGVCKFSKSPIGSNVEQPEGGALLALG